MSRRIPHLRWWIGVLLALVTALSYLDRQSFPLVAGEIRREIPISDQAYGNLISVFLVAYGIMYAGGGWLLDRLGTRLGYALMVAWWSAATLGTTFITSLGSLALCRFLLGMGEGGGFPGSAKAVAEWFPARERSLAFGMFNTGSALGAVVAAPLAAGLVALAGWRSVFVVTGLVGFVWVVIWAVFYQSPERSRWMLASERDELARSRQIGGALPSAESKPSWWALLRDRRVQTLMVAKLLTDSIWFFLIFWLPRYLADARGYDMKAIGAQGWIPFLFAGVGSFGGGWLGSHLMRKGWYLASARKVCLLVPAVLMPAVILVVPAPIGVALALFSLALAAHQAWAATLQTLAADLFPAAVVGSVGGLLGSAGALGAAAYGWFIGGVIERAGYAVPFLLAGVLHPLSFLLVRRVVTNIRESGELGESSESGSSGAISPSPAAR